jgi:polar amino acid transport system permease protein
MSYTLQFSQVTPYLPYLIVGALITLEVSFLAFWGGMVLGLVTAMGWTYGPAPVRWLAKAYVTFFTNTPGLVQI